MIIYRCDEDGRKRLFYKNPLGGWRFIIDGGRWITSVQDLSELYTGCTAHKVNNFKEKQQ